MFDSVRAQFIGHDGLHLIRMITHRAEWFLDIGFLQEKRVVVADDQPAQIS